MTLADLHIHTSFSDGKLSPQEIIDLSKEAGFSTIGITDHDSISGLDTAISYGKSKGIEVIPGIEFSTDLDGKEIHILGYFINYKNKTLTDYLSNLRSFRIKRLEVMIEKLMASKIFLELKDIIEMFPGDVSYGRPHLALSMIKKGFIKNYYEAFGKYIGDGKPACVKKNNPPALEVVKLIEEIGGLSIIAHPGKYLNGQGLFTLINEGIDGIEIIHPSHTPAMRKNYSAIASEHFLLESGGSDFHGIVQIDIDNFGKYFITQKEVNNMKVRLH